MANKFVDFVKAQNSSNDKDKKKEAKTTQSDNKFVNYLRNSMTDGAGDNSPALSNTKEDKTRQAIADKQARTAAAIEYSKATADQRETDRQAYIQALTPVGNNQQNVQQNNQPLSNQPTSRFTLQPMDPNAMADMWKQDNQDNGLQKANALNNNMRKHEGYTESGSANNYNTAQEKYSKDVLDNYSQGGNVNLSKRDKVGTDRLKNAGWLDAGDGYATVYSSTYTSDDGTVAGNFTPITKDGDILTPEQLERYATNVLNGIQADGANLQIGGLYQGPSALDDAVSDAEDIHRWSEIYYGREKKWYEKAIDDVSYVLDRAWNAVPGQLNDLEANLSSFFSGISNVFRGKQKLNAANLGKAVKDNFWKLGGGKEIMSEAKQSAYETADDFRKGRMMAYDQYAEENANGLREQKTADKYPDVGGLTKVAGDTASAVVNMGMSLGVGAVAPELGVSAKGAEILSAAAMGFNSMATAYAEAKNDGATDEQAYEKSGLEFVNNFIGEMAIGGFLGKSTGWAEQGLDLITKGKFSKAFGEAMQGLASHPILKTVAEGTYRSLGEGAEEFVQAIFSVANEKLTYNPDAKLDLRDATYEGLVGFLMSTVLGAPGYGQSYLAYSNDYHTVNGLSKMASEVSTPAQLYKMRELLSAISKDAQDTITYYSQADKSNGLLETIKGGITESAEANTEEGELVIERSTYIKNNVDAMLEFLNGDTETVLDRLNQQRTGSNLENEATSNKLQGLLQEGINEKLAENGQTEQGVVLPTAETLEADTTENTQAQTQTQVQAENTADVYSNADADIVMYDDIDNATKLRTGVQDEILSGITTEMKEAADAVQQATKGLTKFGFFAGNKTRNAYWDRNGNKLIFNVNAIKPVYAASAHEILHSIKGTKAYNTLISYMIYDLSNRGVDTNALYDEYKQRYSSLTKGMNDNETIDYLFEEMCADYLGNRVFTSLDTLKAFAKADGRTYTGLKAKAVDFLARLTSSNYRSVIKEANEIQNSFKLTDEALAQAQAEGKTKREVVAENTQAMTAEIKKNVDEKAEQKAKAAEQKSKANEHTEDFTRRAKALAELNAETDSLTDEEWIERHDEIFEGFEGDQDELIAEAQKIQRNEDVLDDDEELKFSLSENGIAPVRDIKPKERFSLNSSVEETDRLIAVHNLTSSNINSVMDLGGFAMPSIAVIKPDMPHTSYWDITVVFPRSTIDPKANRNNKIYDGDAWTPVFPKIDSKINYKAQTKFIKTIEDLIGDRETYSELGKIYAQEDMFAKEIDDNAGDAYETFKDNPAVKYAYLKHKGEDINLPVKEESYASKFTNAEIEQIAKIVSEEDVNRVVNGGYSEYKNFIEQNPSFVDNLVEIQLQKINEKLLEKKGDELRFLYKEEFSYGEANDALQGAYKYFKYGPHNTVVDWYESQKMLRDWEMDNEYETWLRNLTKDLIEKRGIRNNADPFTSIGNRKSFNALHYELTLENVVKAMRNKAAKGDNAIFGGSEIFGVATKDYSSVEEMRKDSARLYKMDESLYDETRSKITSDMLDLARDIATTKHEKNPFIATDDAASAIADTVRHAKSLSGIDRYLRKEYGYLDIKDNTAERIYNLVQRIQSMPTGYFEAKPLRAVGFNEVLAVVVPDNISKSIEERLTENNLLVVKYKSEDNDDRIAKINLIDGAKFSLSNVNENINYTKDINSATFFAGGGTLDYALKDIVNNTLAVEYNEDIAGIYKLNNGEVVIGDVRDQDMRKYRGKLDHFHASPVCVDYSAMTRRLARQDNDTDITTAIATANAIRSALPTTFTLEQVKGYQGSKALQHILDALEDNGYTVKSGVFNAYDYGGAMSRERFLLMATRQDIDINLPAKTQGKTWYEATLDMLPSLKETTMPTWLQERIDRTPNYKVGDQPVLILSGDPGGTIWFANADEPCPSITTKVDSARIVMPDGTILKCTPSFFARLLGLPDSYDTGKVQKWGYKVIGNGIPTQLVQKFFGNFLDDQFGTGVRFSISAEEDAEYMDLAEQYIDNPAETNKYKLEDMVERAARKSGYNTPKLYHGTNAFGWTVYKDDIHKTPFIYTSTDSSVSGNYAGDNHYAFVKNINNKYQGGDTIESIIKDANSIYDLKLRIANDKDRKYIYDRDVNKAFDLVNKRDEILNDIPQDMPEEVYRAIEKIESFIFTAATEATYEEATDPNGWYKVSDSFNIERFEDSVQIIKDYYSSNYDNLSLNQKRAINFYTGYEVGDFAIDVEFGMSRALSNKTLLTSETTKLIDPQELREQMDLIYNIGSYQLYGNLDDKPFEIDCEGSQFWAIKVPVMGDGYYGTDAICKWAVENGYTSVIMHNIYDYGNKADNYVFFSPNQIKSADLITYDDSGNIIPLSERFNSKNDDIRYSITDNYGYHAGDLGKSTVDDYYNQSYSRGTGHFGFGTYFVGDEMAINGSDYGNRPHEKVDFTKYNLFKPRTEQQGYQLHNALKTIDGYILNLPIAKDYDISNQDAWNNRYTNEHRITNAIESTLADEYTSEEEAADNRRIIDEYLSNVPSYIVDKLKNDAENAYDKAQSNNSSDAVENKLRINYEYNIEGDSWYADEYSSADDYVSKNIADALEYADEMAKLSVEDHYYLLAGDIIKDYIEQQKVIGKKLSDLSDDLYFALGLRHSENEIENALQQTYETVKGFDKLTRGLDSPATVFMKALGYEGVDVRHLKGLDNTGYGSVIYDLKGDDLARKQEIGTARYSISEDNDIRYSMVGEKAAMRAGEWGSIARRDAMMLENPLYNLIPLDQQRDFFENIRQETGWYFDDYSNRWKFEIDDSQASIPPREELVKRNKYKLSEFFRHPTLYDAYPELADVIVTLKKLPKNTLGEFVLQDKEINLNREALTNEESILTTLLHEIQHYIQGQEHWPQGSSPDHYKNYGYNRHSKAYNDINKVLKVLGNEIWYKYQPEVTVFNNSLSYLHKAAEEKADNRLFGYDYYMGIFNDRMDELFKGDIPDIIKMYTDNYLALFSELYSETDTPRGMYQHTMGEIEARDTEGRLRLSEEERRKYRPNVDDPNAIDEAKYPYKSTRYSFSSIPDEFEGMDREASPAEEAFSKARNYSYKRHTKAEKEALIRKEREAYLKRETVAWDGANPAMNVSRSAKLDIANEVRKNFSDYSTTFIHNVMQDVYAILDKPLPKDLSEASTETQSKSRTEQARQMAVDIVYQLMDNDSQFEPNEDYGSREYEEVRNLLRNTPIYVSKSLQHDVGWSEGFRSRNKGRIRFVTDSKRQYSELKHHTGEGMARSVDDWYADWREAYPHIFPEAEGEQEELEGLQTALDRVYNEGSWTPVNYGTEEDRRQIANEVADQLLTMYYAKARLTAAARNNTERIKIQNIDYADKEIKSIIADNQYEVPRSTDEALEMFGKLRIAKAYFDKAKLVNKITQDDMLIVNRLLREETDVQGLRHYDNYEQLLATYREAIPYFNLKKALDQYKKDLKAELYRQADDILMDNFTAFHDKPSRILYAREIAERNIEDIAKGKPDLARLINKTYFAPIHANNAKTVKMTEKYNERVRSLNLNREVAKGNTISESAAVQMAGELQDIINRLGPMIDRGNILHVDRYNEAVSKLADMWKDNPNLNQNKIMSAVDEFRDMYDELLEQLNRTRVMYGYEPIPYRSGYFPHFNDEQPDTLLGKMLYQLNFKMNIEALPTTINGLTEFRQPGIRWQAFANERKGEQTTYDAVQGFDNYISIAADVINHTGDIQRLRAFATEIRYLAGDDGIKEQIKSVRNNEELSEEQKQAEIERITHDAKTSLSEFVVWLDDYINLLANKKSRFDREAEGIIGRKLYPLMRGLIQRVGGNMIAGNLSSALTNFIPLNQANAEYGVKNVVKAMIGTLNSMIGNDDGFADNSSFLINRRGTDRLVDDTSEFSKFIGKPMELIDNFTSEVVTRAAYLYAQDNGIDAESLFEFADERAYRMMANRSKGEMPTIFAAVNPVFKSITQFQLEVNNEWSHLFKDIPRDSKEAKELVGRLLAYFLGAWVFNEFYEAVVGRRAALDPIDLINDTVGDISGYQLPNLVAEIFGDGIQAEDFRTSQGNVFVNLLNNVGEELPFSSAIGVIDKATGILGGEFDGGRIPVTSAMVDLNKISDALKSGSKDKILYELLYNQGLKALSYAASPFGGNQAQKALKGAIALQGGGSYSVSNSGERILQYPVDASDYGEVIQALLFGKSATPGAREWVDNDFNSLNGKKTNAYDEIASMGYDDPNAIYNYLQDNPLNNAEAIYNSGLSDEAKDYLYGINDTTSKVKDNLDFAEEAGISGDDYFKAYNLRKAYHDGNGSISNAETTTLIDTEFNNMPKSQKAVLWRLICGGSDKNNPYINNKEKKK